MTFPNAPWHVGDIFTEINDRIDYWNGLMNYIIIIMYQLGENDVPYMTSAWKKNH